MRFLKIVFLFKILLSISPLPSLSPLKISNKIINKRDCIENIMEESVL